MNQNNKKRKKNIHIRYIDLTLLNGEKKRFDLKKIEKTVKLTAGSIVAITGLVVAINHFQKEPDILPVESVEYIENAYYTPISIQIPITDFEDIEDIGNAFYNYNKEIYNDAFLNKKNYINYLKENTEKSTDYIKATILVDKNYINVNNLIELPEQISKTDKWFSHKVEYGDSEWFYISQAVIKGVRDFDQAKEELRNANNCENSFSLKLGATVVDYNPKYIELEKKYYEIVRNTIDDYAIKEETKKK